MPINIGITFFIGATLGWIVVKIMRPPCHLEGLIVANCSAGNINILFLLLHICKHLTSFLRNCIAGNLGNLLLMIIPALCSEKGSPFADQSNCSERGLSYVSMSMAVISCFLL